MTQQDSFHDSMNTQWIRKVQRREARFLIGFLFLISYVTSNSSTQAAEHIYPPEQFHYETCNEYQLDFLYLVKLLQDSHPNVYANFPEAEFEQEQARILKELETVEDRITSALLFQQFCARLGDAHTTIDYHDVLISQPIFPIEVIVLQNDFYLTNVDRTVDMKYVGAKILAVNGMPTPQVVEKLGSVVSCENEVCRTRQVSHLLQSPDVLQFAGILDDKAPLTLTLITRDAAEHTLSIPTHSQTAVRWTEMKKTEHPVTAQKPTWFAHRIFPEQQWCYFQFNAFLDRQTLQFLLNEMGTEHFEQLFKMNAQSLGQHIDFRDFLKLMFRDIQRHHITSLIIDLRHNRGGKSVLGRQFMSYLQAVPDTLKGYVEGMKFSALMQEQYPKIFEQEKQRYEDHYGKHTLTLPTYVGEMSVYKDVPSLEERTYRRAQFFQQIEEQESSYAVYYMTPPLSKFTGNVFLLIGPETFSSASWFATEMSDNHLATLVGQPISQKPTSFGSNLYFQLPHTEIKGTISYKRFYRPDATKDDEPTLYPDIEVWPTIDDLLNGRDPAFDKVLELIEEQNKEHKARVH